MCRYDSDITCSYPISGHFTEDQRTIYQGVLNAHQAVIKAMKPGVAWPVRPVLSTRTTAPACTATRQNFMELLSTWARLVRWEVGGMLIVQLQDASWCTPCWSVHAGAGAARQNGVSSYQDAALWVGSLPSPSCLDDTGALCTALLTSNTSQWLQ